MKAQQPSRLSAPSTSAALAARKSILRRIRRQEIRRLQTVIPGSAQRHGSRFSEVEIIEDAVRYIDQLHATVIARVRAGTLSPCIFDIDLIINMKAQQPSRLSAPSTSAALAARKSILRRIRRQEIRRLQTVIPGSAQRHGSRFSEVEIIEDAVRYIDQLHATVIARVRAGTLSPSVLSFINPSELERISAQMFPCGKTNSKSRNSSTLLVKKPKRDH